MPEEEDGEGSAAVATLYPSVLQSWVGALVQSEQVWLSGFFAFQLCTLRSFCPDRPLAGGGSR